jgi:hypothetical protein
MLSPVGVADRGYEFMRGDSPACPFPEDLEMGVHTSIQQRQIFLPSLRDSEELRVERDSGMTTIRVIRYHERLTTLLE